MAMMSQPPLGRTINRAVWKECGSNFKSGKIGENLRVHRENHGKGCGLLLTVLELSMMTMKMYFRVGKEGKRLKERL